MQPLKELRPSDAAIHKYQEWYVVVDTKRNSAEDLLRPQYWANCLVLKRNDLIRCVADDGSYDFQLKVETHEVAKGRNAITVSMYPKLTPELIDAAEGTAGNEMIPSVIRGRPVPRVDEIPSKGMWRLIGFDGAPVGDPFQAKSAADGAYDEYLRAHKIEATLDQPAVDAVSGEVVVERPADATRPHQYARSVLKKQAKREGRLAKQRANDAANKERTAARIAAEAAAN